MKTLNTPPNTTKTSPPPPEGEPLADAIRKVSEGFDQLRRSGLNQKAIVVLLRDASGVSKTNIEAILDSLGDLAKRYTTAK